MDTFIEFLLSYGYIGMFIAAFIAGSFFPFASEPVMLGLISLGLNQVEIVIWGTVGNTLGSMFNYWLGTRCSVPWIERVCHISHRRMIQAQWIVRGRGAWMGFFCVLPLVGSAIAVALGILKSNVYITAFSTFLGKLVRYIGMLLIYNGIFELIFQYFH